MEEEEEKIPQLIDIGKEMTEKVRPVIERMKGEIRSNYANEDDVAGEKLITLPENVRKRIHEYMVVSAMRKAVDIATRAGIFFCIITESGPSLYRTRVFPRDTRGDLMMLVNLRADWDKMYIHLEREAKQMDQDVALEFEFKQAGEDMGETTRVAMVMVNQIDRRLMEVDNAVILPSGRVQLPGSRGILPWQSLI